MKKKYILGIDIGTYESKGVLIDETGTVICTHVVSHDLIIEKEGWAEHDAEFVWWSDFCTISKNILKKSNINPTQIASIGCSAIAPCVLPIDKNGAPLRKGILYGIDTRADLEIQELNNLIGEDEILQFGGNALSSQSVSPKILWLKKHEPRIYNKAYKYLTATSYIVGRLTNNYVIDHYTAAAGYAPFYDLKKQSWSLDLLDDLIKIDQLPKILWTTDIAGEITDHASFQTGLAIGTPVITGTSDAASEAISVGVHEPGDTMLMYGSSFFILGITDKMMLDKKMWNAPFLFPNMSCISGGMSTTGSLTRWFRDNFAKDLLLLERKERNSIYNKLADMSKSIPPGSNGLIVLPYFSGERTPINDPKAKGMVFGLSLYHTREHIFRSILEGVGHGIRHNLETLGEIGYDSQSLIAVGGGTKNELWLQIVSDIVQKTQIVNKQLIGAAFGNTILAAIGVKIISDVTKSKDWITTLKYISPNDDNQNIYDKNHKKYLSLYRNTKSLMSN